MVIEAVRNLLRKPSSVVIPEAKSLHLAGSSSILVFQHLHEHRCGDQHFCSAQPAAPMKQPRAEGARVLGALMPTLSPWQAQLFPCSCGSSEPSHPTATSHTQPQQPLPKRFSAVRGLGKDTREGGVRDAGLPLMGTQVKSRLGKVCAEGLGSLVI